MFEFIKFRFLSVALILLSANLAFSQKNTCNLKVLVSELESGASIIEADITIRNLKINESLNSKGQIVDFVFLDLPETDYEITTIRQNYKQSIGKFSLSCKNLDKNGYSYFYVGLSEGDPKEKIETDYRLPVIPKTGTVVASGKLDQDQQDYIKKIQEERLKKFVKINNILNGEAAYLAKPEFPKAAQAVSASGIVYVKIVVDKDGNIESAQAVSGHPLLRQAATEAAKKAKFKPPVINEKPAKFSGFLIYNFTL